MPSIPANIICEVGDDFVLNLIITGMPSIHTFKILDSIIIDVSFKPYYNWNAFNTEWGKFFSLKKWEF